MNKTVNGFTVGQKITWSSAAGQIVGTIKDFTQSLNANRQLIDWVTISCPTARLPDYTAHFAATSSNFAMLKVKAV